MVSFIHSGDIHLGTSFKTASFASKYGQIRRGELWESLERLIKYSQDKEIDFILLAGDVFEEDLFTIKDINKLKDILAYAKKQKIIISPGNHDTLKSNSMYNRIKWPENTYIFKEDGIESLHFEDLKVTIHGYSWTRTCEDMDVLIKGIKKNKDHHNIFILHGDTFSAKDYLPLDIEELKSLNMDYIALGHIHKPQFLTPNIGYCGSLEPLDFGETGQRGFIEGHLGKVNKFVFRSFSKREFHLINLEVTNKMTLEDIVEKVKYLAGEDYDKNFYRVILSGLMPFYIEVRDIEAKLKEEFYHVELMGKYKRDFDIEKIRWDNKDNIIGKYIESFNDEDLEDDIIRDAFYTGLYALLEGGEKL